MSSRARHLRDGVLITNRKTGRRQSPTRAPVPIPDWRLFFSLPAELRFAVADGPHGNVVIEKGYGTIVGANQGWVLDQLAKFLVAVGRDHQEIHIDARLSRDDHGASQHPPRRGDAGHVEIVVASGRPVVVMTSRYMRALVRTG